MRHRKLSLFLVMALTMAMAIPISLATVAGATTGCDSSNFPVSKGAQSSLKIACIFDKADIDGSPTLNDYPNATWHNGAARIVGNAAIGDGGVTTLLSTAISVPTVSGPNFFYPGDVGSSVTAAQLNPRTFITAVSGCSGSPSQCTGATISQNPKSGSVSAAKFLIENGPGRSFTDGVTTAGSNILTSSIPGNFTAADNGRGVSGSCIPDGTTLSGAAGTTVTMSNNATCTSPVAQGISGPPSELWGRGASYTPIVAWAATTTYSRNDVVSIGTSYYRATAFTAAQALVPVAHTGVQLTSGAGTAGDFNTQPPFSDDEQDGVATSAGGHLPVVPTLVQCGFGCGFNHNSNATIVDTVNVLGKNRISTGTITLAADGKTFTAWTGTPLDVSSVGKSFNPPGGPVENSIATFTTATSGKLKTAATPGAGISVTYNQNIGQAPGTAGNQYAPLGACFTGLVKSTTPNLCGKWRKLSAKPIATDTISVGASIENTTARQITDLTPAGSTTVTSASANFLSTDVNLPIVGKNVLAGTYIVSVTNSTTVVLNQAITSCGAVSATCLASGLVPVGISVGLPTITAAKSGEHIAELGTLIALAPTLSAGATACAANDPAGFTIQGTILNPGAYKTTVGFVPNSTGQIMFATPVTSFAAYVVQDNAFSPSHYKIVFPSLPTGAALCGNGAGTAAVFRFDGSTPAQFLNVSGVGKPGSFAMRGLRDQLGTFTATVDGLTLITADSCTVSSPAVLGFPCGNG